MDPETAVFLQFLELNVIHKQADQKFVCYDLKSIIVFASWLINDDGLSPGVWKMLMKKPSVGAFGVWALQSLSPRYLASRGLDAKYLGPLGLGLGT